MSFDGEQQQEEDDINCVLWVGNLDSKVTEAMIYELFFQAGPIKSIRIPKGADGTGHKGYCFIHFYHDMSVPYTMNLMEGTTMFGRKLRLQPRPGSVHRKMLDQKQAEQRNQELLQQQQPQWFQPPMAQLPNMFVYSNQILPSYAAAPNMNVNMGMPFQPQIGTPQLMHILPPQQPPPQVQSHAPPPMAQRNAGGYQPRNGVAVATSQHGGGVSSQQMNGYVPYGMSGMSMPTNPPPRATATSSAPSHFTVANGAPIFQQHPPRGPRHRHGAPHHTQNHVNGNRVPFNPSPRGPPPQQQQPQATIYYSPYSAQPTMTVSAAEPSFHNVNHQPNHQDPQQFIRRQPVAPSFGHGGQANGYQNVQLYQHY